MAILTLLPLALRALQFLFAIIVLGLTGHIASYGNTPSQDSFLVFVSIWTLLAVLYLGLAPRFFPSLTHALGTAALDALTMLFWFAGFVALAVFDHRIHNTDVLDLESGDLFAGCDVVGNVCGVITAAVVFGAFEWALFVATTVLSALEVMRNRGKSTGPTTTSSVV